MDCKVKIGYAPTRRNVFSQEDSLKYKKLIQDKIESWGFEVVDLEGLNEEGLLYDASGVPAAVSILRHAGVDALFTPHCNFGTEDAVAKLARALDKPLLLWGPRDEAPQADHTRLRDTQCGLFATSKVLRRMGVPFTYVINSRVDSEVFERGFKNFAAVAAVVRAFRSLRVGQISTRPGGFWTVMVNEGELLERFAIEVVPISLTEIIMRTQERIESQPDAARATVEEWKQRVDMAAVPDELALLMAAFMHVIQEWADGEGLSAVAIQCWSALQDSLGIMPCFVDSELTGLGLPIACETDVHGAVSSILLQAAVLGASPTFFADLTVRHPDNDSAELLWHCGPFPTCLAAEGCKPSVGRHYILEDGQPGVTDCHIKGGDITIARFDGDHGEYNLLMGHARGTSGPHNRGTYGWAEVGNWPLWEERIIRGPYIHHVANVHGKVAPVLYEACRYIPGLCPDPVEPTEAEIQAWLRGQ